MTETDIRRCIADYARAISAKDIDAVMTFFAPELVSFDLEPPLKYSGADNKRRRWLEAFGKFSTIAYEVTDLHVTTQGELAFVRGLNRFQGTLTGGRTSDVWVRWTACFRLIDGTWRVVHDHVSVPADLPNGKALLDLEPN